MPFRIPGAAKALMVVTAAGLLLGGCHYARPYHGGTHFAPSHHGYKHYHGGYKKRGDGHRHHRHGGRGYH
jgi:hypothetical protein